MGFLSKSRHSKKDKGDYVLPIYEKDTESQELQAKPKEGSAQAPHALTPEEVLGGFSANRVRPSDTIEMQGAVSPVSPLDKLRKKVAASAVAQPEQAGDTVTAQSSDVQNNKSVTVKPNITHRVSTERSGEDEATLLEKCMPFITEGGNKMPEEKPDYTLQSVESIINLTEQKFAKLFDDLELNKAKITYDNLSKGNAATVEPKLSREALRPEIAVTEIPMRHIETAKQPEVTTISDIDATSDFTKTVPFTAVSGESAFEDISSGTKILNLSSEMFDEEHESNKIENLPEQDTDDEFIVPDDYKSPEDTRAVAKRLMSRRRSAFIRAFVSLLLTAVMGLALIPSLRVALLATPMPFYITGAVVFAILILVNFDAVASIKSLFTPRKRPEALVGIAGVSLVVYSIAAIIGKTNPFDVLFTGAVFFAFWSVASFMRASTLINNFKIIAGKSEKYGIKFIDDKQTTFAMARNSIEGDVLAASSVKTANIQDFLKNSYSDSAMCGVSVKFAVAVLAVALGSGIIFAVISASVTMFFEFFALILLIGFAPTAVFTDILPLRRAGKRLNALGAMIAGCSAARRLDVANALTVTSSQLFPDGTVSLHNMKILDPNEIDSTLIDAAAITNEIGSPLKGIFNSIAKTTPTNIPEADTIKYEERLGVSGWIKDRRIFIGNRTLLEAHGISTPPIEVDRKILRQGYFPVYLASGGKPCALLMIKYNVKRDIAVRLQRLSTTGITFLVDSCDPNLTSEMICDYFGLYPESVRVMGGLGCQLNKNATEYQENLSSVAAYKGSLSALAEMFTAAGKIKKSVRALTLFHIISSVAFMLYFIYSTFAGVVMPLGGLTVLLGSLVSFIIYIIIYLFGRP